MGRSCSDRNLQYQRLCRVGCAGESLHDLLKRAVETGSFTVHLVDERDPRHTVTIGLTPDRLALRLDALAGTKHHDAAIENS